MTPFLTPQAIHSAPSIAALLSDKDGVKSGVLYNIIISPALFFKVQPI